MTDRLRQRETIVAEPAWVRTLVWLAFPLLGAGAGWLLKAVAGWAASLPWVPFQGPIKLVDELVASIGEPWATIGALVVGGLGGLVIAFIAAEERLTVAVSDAQVSLARGDSSRVVERAQVSAVFLDGKRLVLLGHGAEELARESSDLEADHLKDAFLSHGFPWRADGDPYEDEYRLWVEDTPDLPAGANALLKARAGAWQGRRRQRRRGGDARGAGQAGHRGPRGQEATVLAPQRRSTIRLEPAWLSRFCFCRIPARASENSTQATFRLKPSGQGTGFPVALAKRLRSSGFAERRGDGSVSRG